MEGLIFIILRIIILLTTSESGLFSNIDSSDVSNVVILFVIFMIFFVPGIIRFMHCEKCGRLGLRDVGERLEKEYTTTKKVTNYIKDKNGNIIATEEHSVPVTKVVCSYVSRCKYCGYEKIEKYEREK